MFGLLPIGYYHSALLNAFSIPVETHQQIHAIAPEHRHRPAKGARVRHAQFPASHIEDFVPGNTRFKNVTSASNSLRWIPDRQVDCAAAGAYCQSGIRRQRNGERIVAAAEQEKPARRDGVGNRVETKLGIAGERPPQTERLGFIERGQHGSNGPHSPGAAVGVVERKCQGMLLVCLRRGRKNGHDLGCVAFSGLAGHNHGIKRIFGRRHVK